MKDEALLASVSSQHRVQGHGTYSQHLYYELPGEERLVSADQFGLHPGLSSADLQTSLYHTWLEALDAGGAVRVVVVDIAGAFDNVSHLGVLHQFHSLRHWRPSPLLANRLRLRQNHLCSRSWCQLFDLPNCRRITTWQHPLSKLIPPI